MTTDRIPVPGDLELASLPDSQRVFQQERYAAEGQVAGENFVRLVRASAIQNRQQSPAVHGLAGITTTITIG